MNRFITAFILIFIFSKTISQTVTSKEEINIQSKEYLLRNDFNNAVPLFKRAAEMGSAEAQYNYGVCYLQGIVVKQNDSIAHHWFLKSANNGYKDAQYQVALNFGQGKVVARDEKKAFYWTLKCAEQIDPDCMFTLINLYKEGVGTERNNDQMMHWAIKLGSLDPPADLKQINEEITTTRANLARVYYYGDRVQKDLVKSYTWFLLYNERKKESESLVQQKNIDIINELLKSISDLEKKKAIADAEKIVRRKLLNIPNLLKQEN
ncbi:MAG: tetratricopeptide repeat protein [Bacteroidota bacterium]|nr:tetratricopeptide repeat protein [Bacteroidota bacterium]